MRMMQNDKCSKKRQAQNRDRAGKNGDENGNDQAAAMIDDEADQCAVKALEKASIHGVERVGFLTRLTDASRIILLARVAHGSTAYASMSPSERITSLSHIRNIINRQEETFPAMSRIRIIQQLYLHLLLMRSPDSFVADPDTDPNFQSNSEAQAQAQAQAMSSVVI